MCTYIRQRRPRRQRRPHPNRRCLPCSRAKTGKGETGKANRECCPETVGPQQPPTRVRERQRPSFFIRCTRRSRHACAVAQPSIGPVNPERRWFGCVEKAAICPHDLDSEGWLHGAVARVAWALTEAGARRVALGRVETNGTFGAGHDARDDLSQVVVARDLGVLVGAQFAARLDGAEALAVPGVLSAARLKPQTSTRNDARSMGRGQSCLGWDGTAKAGSSV